MPRPAITAILCVRNEGALLLDWLAHHRALGVTHVVALSNDCEDGTDAMLDRLAELGGVTHLRNPGPYGAQGVQFAGLDRATETAAVRTADWLIALDIDEYAVVHTGDRTLGALVDAVPDAAAFAIGWRFFGNAGLVGYADVPVTRQFTRAAPRVLHWPWQAMLFKTLYRNDGTYGRPGVHRPRDPGQGAADAVWVDGSGTALPPAFRTDRLVGVPGRDGFALAQVNHYALQSMEAYLLKVARGRAVHAQDRLGMDYWTDRNWCTDEDRSALALPGVDAARAELAADPALARLHAAAVDWRRTRIAALLLEDAWRGLLGRLMMTPPARPLPPALAHRLYPPETAGTDGA